MDIGSYFFIFLVKLIKYLYFILVVWLNLYYRYIGEIKIIKIKSMYLGWKTDSLE